MTRDEGKGDSRNGEIIAALPRVSVQAFCEGMDFGEVMGEVAEDRRLVKVHCKVQMGGVPAAIEAYRDSPTPNVLIVEIHGPAPQIMAQLQELAAVCEADTRVVVVGQVNDIGLYRTLMGHGVSDYLTLPLSALDMVRALSGLFNAEEAKAVGRVIAVLGARGGVGSSTVAHNLAFAMARDLETETCLVDMDLAFGTGGLNFNQDPIQGVADAVATPERLDAAMLDRLFVPCAPRLNLLGAPATLDQTYDFLPDQFMQLLDVLRASLPVTVLDVPHQWTGWTRRIVASADDILIVMTPDLASLRNSRNLIDALRALRPNDSPPQFMINMAGVPKKPEIKTAELTKAIGRDIAATLAFDPAVFGTAANNGQMLAEIAPDHASTAEFLRLAESLLGKHGAKKRKNGLDGLFDQLAPMLSAFSALRKKAG